MREVDFTRDAKSRWNSIPPRRGERGRRPEEVQEAALILNVSDVSNPQQTELDAEVEKILKDLGVEATPRLQVFNKIDRLSQEQLAAFAAPRKSP